MKKVLLLTIIFGFLGLAARDNGIRPIRDDVGFCWQMASMDRLMHYLEKTAAGKPGLENLVGGISPHDDYLYAGPVYYPLFRQIKTGEVVIFGVTHGSVRRAIGDPQGKVIFDDYTYWQAPYGRIEISPLRSFLKQKLDPQHYLESSEAHRLEHSIEALLPFLQYFNRQIKITPIMVTGMDFDTMNRKADILAQHIAAYIRQNNLKPGRDIFFLISADANHYGKDFDNTVFGEDERAHERATDLDQKIAHSFLSGTLTPAKIKGLTGALWGKTYRDYKDTVWCGKYSIPFGLLTILKVMNRLNPRQTLTAEILMYADTYSNGVLPLKKLGCGITAPFSLKHWVSFLSAALYLK
jgi:AmmeMemoRadiSam system protein B